MKTQDCENILTDYPHIRKHVRALFWAKIYIKPAKFNWNLKRNSYYVS